MNYKFVFVDRRSDDRRTDLDPCKKMPIDLYHRKRRKSTERRDTQKSLIDDYYAFIESKEEQLGNTPEQANQENIIKRSS